MTAKASEARLRANARYNAKTYDVITIRALKGEAITDRIEQAAARASVSKNKYILDAIRARLDADNITSDDI